MNEVRGSSDAFITTRCFYVQSGYLSREQPYNRDRFVRTWSRAFFDIGEQGVVLLKGDDLENDRYPNTEMMTLQVVDEDQNALIGIYRVHGNRLKPEAILKSSRFEKAPAFRELRRLESFAIIPEPYDDLLIRLRNLIAREG